MPNLSTLIAGFKDGNGVVKLLRFAVLALLFSGVIDAQALAQVLTEGGDANTKLQAFLAALGLATFAGTSTNNVSK